MRQLPGGCELYFSTPANETVQSQLTEAGSVICGCLMAVEAIVF